MASPTDAHGLLKVARRTRELTTNLRHESRQTRDRADVLVREAEALCAAFCHIKVAVAKARWQPGSLMDLLARLDRPTPGAFA